MKFPCTLKNAFLTIRDRFGLSFASKGLGYLAALLLLLPLPLLACYKLSCYETTMLLTISALADITLLKTTCHFLLLLVGFDTLTYRKELQLIRYTCGPSPSAISSGASCLGGPGSSHRLCYPVLSHGGRLVTGHLCRYITGRVDDPSYQFCFVIPGVCSFYSHYAWGGEA